VVTTIGAFAKGDMVGGVFGDTVSFMRTPCRGTEPEHLYSQLKNIHRHGVKCIAQIKKNKVKYP